MKIREIGRLNLFAEFQNNGAFNHIPKFAYVPWPVMPQQDLLSRFRESFDRPIEHHTEVFQKVFCQQDDILGTVPEWGRTKLNHVQSMKQILPKMVFADGVDNVPVGGG